MNQHIETTCCALQLPDGWDSLADNYFQTRAFLHHTEVYNPCNQKYYLFIRDGLLRTALVIYTLKLDMLTYLSIPSPFRMQIIGIPCSVSSHGIIGEFAHVDTLISAIRKDEKGLLLMLNLNRPIELEGFTSGRTLPTIHIKNDYNSWESYLSALRADYRRRILSLSKPFAGIRQERGSCSEFTDNMYSQYLNVLKRSRGKLETLSCEFFRNLPEEFNLTAYYHAQFLLGWAITLKNKRILYFFLGGINYQLNKIYNTYFNILSGIVKEGIQNKVSIIDLGQTAEIPKTRLGGTVKEMYMLGNHSNRFLNGFLRAGRHLLEYKRSIPATHVFKEAR